MYIDDYFLSAGILRISTIEISNNATDGHKRYDCAVTNITIGRFINQNTHVQCTTKLLFIFLRMELDVTRANNMLRVNVGDRWICFSENYFLSALMDIAYMKSNEYEP